MSTLVSVIIPVYNQEKYVARCIRSLLDQSLDSDKYEIIVINDGSSDKTEKILAPFNDKVRLMKNEKNIGLPGSLNLAIKSSKSPYIVRVDSDDFVNSNFLFILLFYLQQNKHMHAVSCDYLLIDEEEEIIERKKSRDEPIACGIMFRKDDLFDIGLYDEEFLVHEERDLMYRFLGKYTLFHIELPLYRYRKHENNLTNNKQDYNYFVKKLKQKHNKRV